MSRVYLVCLAFQQSVEEQEYDGPALDVDYARVRLGPFDRVRACYDSIEAWDDGCPGGYEEIEWDGDWWRVANRPDLPGFSDVEIRHESEDVAP